MGGCCTSTQPEIKTNTDHPLVKKQLIDDNQTNATGNYSIVAEDDTTDTDSHIHTDTHKETNNQPQTDNTIAKPQIMDNINTDSSDNDESNHEKKPFMDSNETSQDKQTTVKKEDTHVAAEILSNASNASPEDIFTQPIQPIQPKSPHSNPTNNNTNNTNSNESSITTTLITDDNNENKPLIVAEQNQNINIMHNEHDKNKKAIARYEKRLEQRMKDKEQAKENRHMKKQQKKKKKKAKLLKKKMLKRQQQRLKKREELKQKRKKEREQYNNMDLYMPTRQDIIQMFDLYFYKPYDMNPIANHNEILPAKSINFDGFKAGLKLLNMDHVLSASEVEQLFDQMTLSSTQYAINAVDFCHFLKQNAITLEPKLAIIQRKILSSLAKQQNKKDSETKENEDEDEDENKENDIENDDIIISETIATKPNGDIYKRLAEKFGKRYEMKRMENKSKIKENNIMEMEMEQNEYLTPDDEIKNDVIQIKINDNENENDLEIKVDENEDENEKVVIEIITESKTDKSISDEITNKENKNIASSSVISPHTPKHFRKDFVFATVTANDSDSSNSSIYDKLSKKFGSRYETRHRQTKSKDEELHKIYEKILNRSMLNTINMNESMDDEKKECDIEHNNKENIQINEIINTKNNNMNKATATATATRKRKHSSNNNCELKVPNNKNNKSGVVGSLQRITQYKGNEEMSNLKQLYKQQFKMKQKLERLRKQNLKHTTAPPKPKNIDSLIDNRTRYICQELRQCICKNTRYTGLAHFGSHGEIGMEMEFVSNCNENGYIRGKRVIEFKTMKQTNGNGRIWNDLLWDQHKKKYVACTKFEWMDSYNGVTTKLWFNSINNEMDMDHSFFQGFCMRYPSDLNPQNMVTKLIMHEGIFDFVCVSAKRRRIRTNSLLQYHTLDINEMDHNELQKVPKYVRRMSAYTEKIGELYEMDIPITKDELFGDAIATVAAINEVDTTINTIISDMDRKK